MERMDKTVNRAVNQAVSDLGGYIRAQRSTAQISLRQLAKRAGVSNPYLSQVERGLRKPSAEILQQIAKALRISAEALYVQAGILDRREGGPVVDAILADGDLSERQKQVLLDIYAAFRREQDDDVDADVPGSAPAGADPQEESGQARPTPAQTKPNTQPGE